MAKRRFRVEDRRPVEEETVEDRRERRHRSGKGKRPELPAKGWRRAILPGAAAAVIVVVVVLFVWGPGHLFTEPCLQFQPIPSGSGSPAFPASNTTGSGFATTWCPGDTPVFQTYPRLTILVGGSNVVLPPAIGISSNFTSYTCTLPIHTQAPSATLPSGTISIESAWPYQYTLGQFFQVWQDSYVSAHVNASYSTRTIDYTSTDLLGLPADATHSLTLFVDNQVRSDGPSLILNTLDGSGSTTPGCLGKVYGTGHSIELVYQSSAPTAIVGGGPTHLATAVPGLPDGPLYSPHAVAPVPSPEEGLTESHASWAGFGWLGLRPVG